MQSAATASARESDESRGAEVTQGVYIRTKKHLLALSKARKADWRDPKKRDKIILGMNKPEVRAKVAKSLKRTWIKKRTSWIRSIKNIGGPKISKAHKGKMFFKGGNGQPPVRFVVELEKLLSPVGYIREYSIGIPKIKERGAGSYKVDFALVSAKIAIECDGRSHCSSVRKAQDRKKDLILHRFGWKVIRVPHD